MSTVIIEVEVSDEMARMAELPFLKSWIKLRAIEAVDEQPVNDQLIELRAAARDE